MDAVTIDGSAGEGGGQMLRTAGALAVRTGQSVVVENVRAGRSTPGLRPQHVSALEVLAEICAGELVGAEVGSDRIELHPGPIQGGTVEIDTGTAASTTLLLETLLPLAPALPEPLVLEARGGTDTKWAPTLVHLREVLLPWTARAGVQADLLAAKEGFYPKGGGGLRARIHPAGASSWPGVLEERGTLSSIGIRVRLDQLPDHVGERVAQSCAGALEVEGLEPDVKIERVDALSPGVVVDAIARYEHSVLGANAIGEKGVPSEEVGTRCAHRLLAEIGSDATVDVHAADQLVPLLLDEPGTGYQVSELTGHLRTNALVAGRFLPGRASFEQLEQGHRVRFEPA